MKGGFGGSGEADGMMGGRVCVPYQADCSTAGPSRPNAPTWKRMPLSLVASTRRTASAVRTGTVDFSTTILGEVDTSAILRAQSSQFLTLAARPAPIPCWFCGGVGWGDWCWEVGEQQHWWCGVPFAYTP